MPEVFRKNGWRFFFYSNEGNEPIHIHCQNSEKTCKFFIDIKLKELYLADSKNVSNSDISKVKKMIIDNLDVIILKWNEHFKR
ncbi:MAG TPA: DUF4160 domain-containing protein [Ignavibacteria bacterium]|nr:DUF4160 domain-containing protein [Ignavibacteria bacterium]